MQKPAAFVDCAKCKNRRYVIVKETKDGKTIDVKKPCECTRSSYLTK